ncbi:MAG TPA: alpha/beta hydrolase [Solirubrobacteraceae bacterium]|nr:alpha/beta hydrolase [Solirubrobacteraceae bacterium]
MTTLQTDLVEVISPDGTKLGVERVGSGPPLLAVHGGIGDRTRWTLLKERIADRFTLHLLDRRGRGASTQESTAPYALDREIDDVLAVVDAIGQPVRYLGHSYGALIGLEALARTGAIERSLLYEPPFDTPGHATAPAAVLDRMEALIDGGDREAALELFYRQVLGADPTPFKALPMWPVRIAIAHTIVREGRIGLDYACVPERFAAVRAPTRILLGTESPAPFRASASAAAAAIPGCELVLLHGQGHTMIDADPDGFVRQVTDFLG